jgi:hypothetical protein
MVKVLRILGQWRYNCAPDVGTAQSRFMLKQSGSGSHVG